MEGEATEKERDSAYFYVQNGANCDYESAVNNLCIIRFAVWLSAWRPSV